MARSKTDYIKLIEGLEFSQENIVELIQITGEIIRILEEMDPNRASNSCLHYLMLIRSRELTDITHHEENKFTDRLEALFITAKFAITHDLAGTQCNNWK